ncbi:hypothetical protein FOZ60_013991 [Perkinsus olseni]|uniref:Uncharacterized protein n=1 Tax=Perkinsus olseni TaxID=32597 RepID=A0A7J6N9L6_PEROL|nr:hypothetical protein FOZ60_013991 [Perkinsus olseni]
MIKSDREVERCALMYLRVPRDVDYDSQMLYETGGYESTLYPSPLEEETTAGRRSRVGLTRRLYGCTADQGSVPPCPQYSAEVLDGRATKDAFLAYHVS